MTQLCILHIPPDGDARGVLDERLQNLIRVVQALELDNSVVCWPVTSEEEQKLQSADVIWWAGKIVFQETMNEIWSYLTEKNVSAVSYENPDAVEESFNLERSYHILQEQNLPQAETTFVPLSDEEIYAPKDVLTKVLRRKIRYWWYPRQGVFFRTFYGTRKTKYYSHIARNRKELLSGVVRLIEDLRSRQKIGGIALRNYLSIQETLDKSLNFFQREFRVFVVFGQPIIWLYTARDLKKTWGQTPASIWETITPSGQHLKEILRLSKIVGQTLQSKIFVIDFAILQNDKVVILETNPGHCSGWIHEISYLAVYGNFFRRLTNEEFFTENEIQLFAEKLEIGLWGRGVVWNFL